MRLLCLVLAGLLSIGAAVAEIKNGYLEIERTRVSLSSLNALAAAEMTSRQSRKVKANIRILSDHIAYFELTEAFLSQFKTIAPELWSEASSLRDKNGNPTDVFVKLISKEDADVPHRGTTYIKYNKGDDTCYSEYGPQTVSIKIWITETSLNILAHELGHAKYMVPNLAAYDEYHEKNYRLVSDGSNTIGHSPTDPSGKSAFSYERRFNESYRRDKGGSSLKTIPPGK